MTSKICEIAGGGTLKGRVRTSKNSWNHKMLSEKNYIFSLPPEHLLPFFEDYLEDEDEIDPKAGGGDPMTIGQMVNPRKGQTVSIVEMI